MAKYNNDLGAPEFGSNNYKALEQGEYDAVVHGIVSLGLRPDEFTNEAGAVEKKDPKIYLRVIFEIPGKLRDDGTTVTTSKSIKLTRDPVKGNWGKFLTSLGERVDKDSIDHYKSKEKLNGLLGKSVVVDVAEWKNGEGSSIATFRKLDPRLPQPKATRGVFFFNPLSPDLKIFRENLTFKTQQEVMSALNANQFPRELHEAWAEAQVARENEQQDNKAQPKQTAPHDSNNYHNAVDWNEESI